MDCHNSNKLPVQFYQRQDGEYVLSEYYIPSYQVGLTCMGEVFKSEKNRYSKETTLHGLHIRDITMNIPFDYEETEFPLEYANRLRTISNCTKLSAEQNEFIKNVIPKIFPQRVLPPKEDICPKVTQVVQGELESGNKPRLKPSPPTPTIWDLFEEDMMKFPKPIEPIKAAPNSGNPGSDDNKNNPFICPISQEIMKDPVSAADGHSYERKEIELWLSKHDTSPLTNEKLPNKDLKPNWALKNAIEFSNKK